MYIFYQPYLGIIQRLSDFVIFFYKICQVLRGMVKNLPL